MPGGIAYLDTRGSFKLILVYCLLVVAELRSYQLGAAV